MSDAFAAPASRNAPCPCGSGRRWKDCHGRVVAGDARSADRSAMLASRMQQALLLQRGGRFAEAIALYGEVIETAPETVDAWHMRGVSRLQSHEFDGAEADIRRALALKPDIPLGESNLALVDSGRRTAAAAEALSRAALARFRPLAVDPPVAPLEGVRPGMRCYVVDLGATSAGLAERIAHEAAARGASVPRSGAASAGHDDVVVAVGCRVTAGDWAMACAPHAVALVADGDSVGDVEDRLRELSAEGRRRVRLAVAAGSSLDLAPVPHTTLAP